MLVHELLAGEPLRRRGGNDGQRDHHRRDDRHRDGEGEIGKELAGFVFEEHDGQEDGDGGRGRREQRAPHLLRPHERRLLRVHAPLAQPDDVLEHDDGGVEGHPHRERETGERNDVDGPPGSVEAEERRKERHRYRHRNQQRRAEPPQEPPQHHDGEHDAQSEVVADHLDRAMNVDGLVVDLPERQVRAREGAPDEFHRCLLEARHHFQDVHADLAMGVHRDRAHPVGEHEALAIDERDLDVGHVAQPHREAVAPFQHQPPELLGTERSGEPQRVAALADAHVPARDVLVGAGQACRGRKLDSEARRLVRVEGDADFAFASAVDLGACDTGYALEPRLDHLLGVVLVTLDVAGVPFAGARDEPGDGTAVAADGVDDRLVGVLGIARNAVEAVEDLNEAAAQVVPDHELDGHLALAALGLGDDAVHPRQPAQHLFLRLDDLRLDLLGSGGAPRGADGDLRPLDLGGELDRKPRQAERTEQGDEEHRDQRRGRVGERESRPAHPAGWADLEGLEGMTATGCPGRSRSPPRITTRSPAVMPSTSMRSPWAMPGVTATRSARSFSPTR